MKIFGPESFCLDFPTFDPSATPDYTHH